MICQICLVILVHSRVTLKRECQVILFLFVFLFVPCLFFVCMVVCCILLFTKRYCRGCNWYCMVRNQISFDLTSVGWKKFQYSYFFVLGSLGNVILLMWESGDMCCSCTMSELFQSMNISVFSVHHSTFYRQASSSVVETPVNRRHVESISRCCTEYSWTP